MAKFTDRFIKVPTTVFNIKQKELTGKEVLEQTYIKFNPFDISEYRPAYQDDLDEGENKVSVTLKDGNSILVYLTIDEFEKLLNNFNT